MATDKNDSGMLSKLKSKLDRMLGRKSSETLGLIYKPSQNTPSARKAFRIDVDNMHVICRSPRIKCRISDISATGIGFISSKDFPIGETVDAVLLWSGKPVLKNLKIKIVRHDGKIVGCEFQNLKRDQDKIISKIVLAAQKRLIQKKHNGKKTDKVEEEVTLEVKKYSTRKTKKNSTQKIKL